MQGQRVQEYTTEMGLNGLPVARLGKVHNLVTFINSGQPKLHYLDGKWCDDGGNEIPLDKVPLDAQHQVRSIPFTPDRRDADVVVNCEFCEWTAGSREYAKHLTEKHIRPLKPVDPTDGAGQPVDPEQRTETLVGDAVETQRRFKPEDLPPDNYVLDDEGFVVLNKDGTPRRKAGRPSAESKE